MFSSDMFAFTHDDEVSNILHQMADSERRVSSGMYIPVIRNVFLYYLTIK